MRSVSQTFARPQAGPSHSRWRISHRGAGQDSSDAQHVRKPMQAANANGPGHGHDFSRVRVSSAPPRSTQARLQVGRPQDRFEREADLVADQVMGTPTAEDGPLNVGQERVTPEWPSNNAGTQSVRCAADQAVGETETEAAEPEEAAAHEDTELAPGGREETARSAEQVAAMLLEEDDLERGQTDHEPARQPAGAGSDTTVQAREVPGQTPTVSSRQEATVNSMRSGGQPLPAASRSFFEPRFGHDFSHVRVHTGADADQMARAFRAKALTVGRDMVFGVGQYQPATRAGQWLMAHELTHVLQQQEGLNRAPSAGIPVQHTARDQVQGGFFGSLWSGIKKGASAVGSAVSWAAGKAWSGIKAVGKWGWKVLESGAALAWRLVVNFPERVWRLIKHLGSGIAGIASWLWQGLKLAVKLDFKGLGEWSVNGILAGAAWVGRLVGKLVDIAGIGEVWDLLSQIIKFNTRALTSDEKSEAQKVFKSSISYWQIRVDEYSLIAKIASAFKGGVPMGVTTFHTVNFNQKITATPGSRDMRWLTHELTHVSQYEHAGAQYLGEAIHAQATTGYPYGGPAALWRAVTHVAPNAGGSHFSQFNREQQGEIAADYYDSLYHTVAPNGFMLTPTDYEPVIDELREGNL